ncbi:PTS beta-glucoside transporter subunit IIBCA [Olsenella sp. HMSC062G07]|uniref:PTS beta-glucoside transporter subunit IIBCA n=1 Tax=Olsenella sp. HMSC062G07 TaxID=1739330 RepID=UPI0008A12E90|nr:PTS beta-glucoside transporter subunit IIBCA [Olsenella sp. HMSC062G07]OFK22689.1 PTS beta-glucoside transporter subunit EIIBCA [Olsenella sp. HMSC062G07]
MALDHAQAAKEILKAVGGPGNIVSAAHCATRLRLVIADDSKVDKAAVDDAAGAKGSFQAAGQLQVIYGTGTVNKVFDEFVAQSGVAAGSKDDVKAAAAAKGNLLQRAIKALGDVFVPIIPAIVASGLLMGLTEGINNAMGGALDTNSWYILIHTFSNASFVFLQILIGFSAARVFGGNEFLGGVIGMIMNHTALINAWSIPGALGNLIVGSDATANVLGLDSAANATTSAIIAGGYVPQVQLFGIYDVTLQGYQGHVIPVVIAVFIMCMLEKWLHKHVPDMLDLFVTPLVTVLVTGTLTLTLIGPFFSWVENGVMYGFQFLLAIPFGLGGALVGAIYPVTVVLGVHHMFNALEATLIANVGVDNFNPIISCCNVAQGAACLAVFVKTRSMKKKELALPSGISGFLGITEPAIYGVNLPNMKPFVAAMIGGAVGGVLVSMLGVVSIAYGITGIFGFLITTGHTVAYAACILVAAAVAFAITWTLYKDVEEGSVPVEKKPEVEKVVATTQAAANQTAAVTEAVAESNQGVVPATSSEVLVSPMTGTVIPMTEVSDPVFSSEAMGKGAAIEPTEGKVLSPVNGTITILAATGHAIGLLSDGGAEVLIHIGIDTVNLKGAPFTAKCKVGDQVKAGDLLMDVDLGAIEVANLPKTTMVIVTNTDEYAQVVGMTGKVKAGERLVELDK